jgi:8-oxo-dGTP pyrophosphatase MutT (NUDIX family)
MAPRLAADTDRMGRVTPDPPTPDPPAPDPAAEVVAVYDAAGAVVGAAPRGEVYARSLWHGVGGVLLRGGPDGERVYVHRRTDTKLVMPGLHDCWAGGVVDAGETPEQTAARELAEELGVTGVALHRLFPDVGSVVYDEGAGGLRSHLFAFEAFWDGPVRHQPGEVADGGWMALSELRARLADPAWPFVPDGRLLVTRWFAERGTPVSSSPAARPPGRPAPPATPGPRPGGPAGPR